MPSAIRATILIAFFSILSKILGAARQAVFANRFGAGEEIDIYVAAFRVPDLLFNLLILGTLSAAFIPVFVGYLKKDRQEALRVASSIFNFTLLVMAVVAVVGFFSAPILVKFVAPGFSEQAQAQTAVLTRIMMLSPLLFSLSSVLTSVLHSHKRFLVAAIAPLFYNLSIMAGVLFIYPVLGLKGLAWGVVIGALLHFLVQLPSAFRLGLRPFVGMDLRHRGVREIARLYIPRIFGIDLGQISILIASVIGSGLATGSLAIFYFAYDLNAVPLGVFAISFSIATFPILAEFVSKKDYAGFRLFFAQTAVQILFFIIPISVLILLLRAQIVRLILGAGENTLFDFTATKLTAQALGFFVLSLFAQSLTPLLARSFYALHNTIIPVLAGITAAVVNITLAVSFTRFAGADTLALAFSISAILNMLILLALLHRRLHGLADEFLVLRTTKIGIASIIMGVATYITLYAVAPLVNMQTYLGILIQTVSAVVVAIVTYLIAGLLIRLPETRGLVKVLKVWFHKFTRPVTSAIVDMFTDIR